jgi:hypothetical protein
MLCQDLWAHPCPNPLGGKGDRGSLKQFASVTSIGGWAAARAMIVRAHPPGRPSGLELPGQTSRSGRYSPISGPWPQGPDPGFLSKFAEGGFQGIHGAHLEALCRGWGYWLANFGKEKVDRGGLKKVSPDYPGDSLGTQKKGLSDVRKGRFCAVFHGSPNGTISCKNWHLHA